MRGARPVAKSAGGAQGRSGGEISTSAANEPGTRWRHGLNKGFPGPVRSGRKDRVRQERYKPPASKNILISELK